MEFTIGKCRFHSWNLANLPLITYIWPLAIFDHCQRKWDDSEESVSCTRRSMVFDFNGLIHWGIQHFHSRTLPVFNIQSIWHHFNNWVFRFRINESRVWNCCNCLWSVQPQTIGRNFARIFRFWQSSESSRILNFELSLFASLLNFKLNRLNSNRCINSMSTLIIRTNDAVAGSISSHQALSV